MDDTLFFPFYYDLNREFEHMNDRILTKKETERQKSINWNEKENEWEQEYHLIYNSYILDIRGIA